ncbi:CheW domain protein [hydrothermal vent metagenome]|uniref:CheW domain protein n=1 Tax=hydrothermal vent metagenome TaxID=652676 RepID=A0A3B0ZKZ1_9ZZZZ
MAKQNNNLVEQSEALTDFFESLMRDVDAYQEQADEVSPQVVKKDNAEQSILSAHAEEHPTAIETGVTPPEHTQTELKQDVIAENLIKIAEPETKLFETLPPVLPESELLDEVTSLIEPVVTKTHEPKPNEVVEKTTENEELPEWCQHEFQAMLFKVAGLTLAVPLIDLNGVVECNLDDISAMPGHADFYLGLMKYLDKNVPLVDTAKFVLPADKLSTLMGDEPSKRVTRAVMIHDCQYGLACDEVNEVVTLKPEEVRWRTQRTRRCWLAGTVIEHMCALIDATAFAELLAERTPIQVFRE